MERARGLLGASEECLKVKLVLVNARELSRRPCKEGQGLLRRFPEIDYMAGGIGSSNAFVATTRSYTCARICHNATASTPHHHTHIIHKDRVYWTLSARQCLLGSVY